MGFLGRINEMFKDDESYIDEEENFSTGDEGTEEAFDAMQSAPAAAPKSTGVGSTAALEMKVVKPERMDSAFGIGDHLLAKRTVVLNFEDTNKETVRRILDFLSGVAYANDGQIKKVANCTFIITPYNVGLMGDLLDELENNGLYF